MVSDINFESNALSSKIKKPVLSQVPRHLPSSIIGSIESYQTAQQVVADMPKFQSNLPKNHLQRHAAHLTKRIKNLENALSPNLPQDSAEYDSKFLSLKYYPVTDSWGYRLALNLSTNVRGIVDNKMLNFEDLEKELLTTQITKKTFLSMIAKMSYDPGQYLGGFVAILRLSYRQLLIESPNQSWCSIVDKKYLKHFLTGIRQIYLSCYLEFPRIWSPLWYDKEIDSIQPICISDAGEDSLGFVLYLKHFYRNKATNELLTFTVLVKAASKICPLSYLSMPKKELISFEFAISEVKHFMEYIKPYYENVLPVLYFTDSLSLLQKLTINSCVFESFSASRLQKIRELVFPQNLFKSIGFLRGGKNVSQANLADVLTKQNMRIYHLASPEFFYGSWLNKKQEFWPVTYLENLQKPNIRLFTDLLKKYSSYAHRLKSSSNLEQQTESDIKNNLIFHLTCINVDKPKIKKKDESAGHVKRQYLNHCKEATCVFYNSVETEDCPKNPELDNLCPHELPINWLASSEPEPIENEVIKKVHFLPTVDIQNFDKSKPVIDIHRFMPLNENIFQQPLERAPTSKKFKLLILMQQMEYHNKEHLNSDNSHQKHQVNITSIRTAKKAKLKGISKRATKIKPRIVKSSIPSRNKIAINNDLSIRKFSKATFKPNSQVFDSLLDSKDNIFDVFQILARMLKWTKRHKKVPTFLLFHQIEKSLLRLCTQNMINYLRSTQVRSDRFALVDGIILERLRGASPNHDDLCARVFLAPNLSFSRCLMRTVHEIYCGSSSKFQRSILFKLGFNLGDSQKYFEFLTTRKCKKCLRRQAESQQNQPAPIPRAVCLFSRPYAMASADLSYHYYYKDKIHRSPILLCHFVCLQSTHTMAFSQESASAQQFLNSVMQLIAFTGSTPSLLLVDQGTDVTSVSKQIRQLEEDMSQGEVKKGEKTKLDFKDYIMKFTRQQQDELSSALGKMSCLLQFHPANTSFQTPAENIISQFRDFWKKCSYHTLRHDLFSFNTCISLTNMALNKRPLFLIRANDASCYEISSQDIFAGKISEFSEDKYVQTLHPLEPHSVLAHLSKLGQQAKLAFQILHSERFNKLISFYKQTKNTNYTKLLQRPLSPGDICLMASRSSTELKLCEVVKLSQPGVKGYAESSEAHVRFFPYKHAKISENIKTVWTSKLTRVHIKNLSPIMAKEDRFIDFTQLDDHPVSRENMQEINAEISKIPKNRKEQFWSKLISHDILSAPLSRIILNEREPEASKDPYYKSSRKLKLGVDDPPVFSPGHNNPKEILKNLLPGPDFASKAGPSKMPKNSISKQNNVPKPSEAPISVGNKNDDIQIEQDQGMKPKVLKNKHKNKTKVEEKIPKSVIANESLRRSSRVTKIPTKYRD